MNGDIPAGRARNSTTACETAQISYYNGQQFMSGSHKDTLFECLDGTQGISS
jgi:hypothetical protein